MTKIKKILSKYKNFCGLFVLAAAALVVFLVFRGITSPSKEKSAAATGDREAESFQTADSREEENLRKTESPDGAGSLNESESSNESESPTEDGSVNVTEEPEKSEPEEAAEDQEEETVSQEMQHPQVEIVHDWAMDYVMIVSEGTCCMYDGEKYGFMKQDEERITPFAYDIAYPFHEGLACVCIEGKYGYIDTSGELVIPMIYDRATPFMEGLAYFVLGDAYGFMDRTGTVVFELECDSVSSFQEGLAYFSVDGQYGYIDAEGQIVIEAAYDDAEYFRNGLARVMKNGKYGVIGRDGSCVLAPEYDDVQMDDSYIIAQRGGQYDCFDMTGNKLAEEPYEDLSAEANNIRFRRKNDAAGVLLKNEVTPRMGQYWEFLQSSFVSVGGQEGRTFEVGGVFTVSQEELNGCQRTYKLYDMEHSGKPVLYFYARSYESLNSWRSYSGFYAIRNGQLTQLIAGYECGGTGGGDYVCLWYDRQTGSVMPGNYGAWGGFGGETYGGIVYDYEKGKTVFAASFLYKGQNAGNYDDEELLAYAELFYSVTENVPYTKETILEAGAVTEYLVAGERTTVEAYQETAERYQRLSLLD